MVLHKVEQKMRGEGDYTRLKNGGISCPGNRLGKIYTLQKWSYRHKGSGTLNDKKRGGKKPRKMPLKGT